MEIGKSLSYRKLSGIVNASANKSLLGLTSNFMWDLVYKSIPLSVSDSVNTSSWI